ncbi:phage integrase N-terminal SAM-like domain-containing protein [Candidatus Kuenenia stuttgartiensis]|nr:MAG: hypothetical protein CV080_08015 [Candidatus Kuenenia stuttgartiensis]
MGTEKRCVNGIKRFIIFHGKRHPLHIGEHGVSRFLSRLAIKKQVSAFTQNQA